jgi:phenylacetate-CoA ligase
MSLEDHIYPLLRRYISAPQWVKYVAGSCYRALPDALRMGSKFAHFDAVRRLKGRDTLQAYAEQRLRETLQCAANSVPAFADYRQVANSGLPVGDILGRFPFCSKTDVKKNLQSYLSNAVPARRRLAMFTGGSTAEPMLFYLEKSVSRARESAFVRDFEERLGRGQRDTTLSLRGVSIPSAAVANKVYWMYEPIKRRLVLSCDHLERRNMPEYIGAIERRKLAYIEAYPSALEPLARWLDEFPRPDITQKIKGILLYSENVYPEQMALFRRVFACPVLKHYGHSERVLMAASTPDDDRYYFWPQYGWLELIDMRGRPVTQPGEIGEIVGTSFDNQVMPFVRYRTGDIGVLSASEHSDLPGFPVIERIEGRLQEFVVCKDERLVSITTLGAAHFSELYRCDAMQYEQHTAGQVVLHIAVENVLPDEIKRKIEDAIERKTQGGCTAHVEQVGRIARTPTGKHKMLIQHLDVTRYFGAARREREKNEEDSDARHGI